MSLFSAFWLGVLGTSLRRCPPLGPSCAWRMRASVSAHRMLDLDALPRPVAETDCWRPTIDDVDRISWGRNAKQKGTGSRGVPHRLNDDERSLYDFARRKGFVEIGGSGWRSERRDSPLVNTFRSWCDARGVPAIYLHKGRDGTDDQVVVDLAPLRTPLRFEAAAAFCLGAAPNGTVEFEGRPPVDLRDAEDANDDDEQQRAAEAPAASASEPSGARMFSLEELAEAYVTQPIYRLPMYAVSWVRGRSEAKELAKLLAESLGTSEDAKGRRKEQGSPQVRPGKSRRSGGYGIG